MISIPHLGFSVGNTSSLCSLLSPGARELLVSRDLKNETKIISVQLDIKSQEKDIFYTTVI